MGLYEYNHTYDFEFRGHTFYLYREEKKEDWWVMVTHNKTGCYSYDGVERDSADLPIKEVINRVCDGCLLARPKHWTFLNKAKNQRGQK